MQIFGTVVLAVAIMGLITYLMVRICSGDDKDPTAKP
jgi:hypothetical protein